jgi:hypothetical protein
MKTIFTRTGRLALAATTILIGSVIQPASARGLLPLRLHGTITIQSAEPIGVGDGVVTMRVLATDVGWGTHFGHFTSTLEFEVDFDVVTGAPLRGGGIVVQTNADGSTVTWENHFEGTATASRIVDGTRRFRHARGWVRGESVLNEDGTISYREKGWITSIGFGHFFGFGHSCFW